MPVHGLGVGAGLYLGGFYGIGGAIGTLAGTGVTFLGKKIVHDADNRVQDWAKAAEKVAGYVVTAFGLAIGSVSALAMSYGVIVFGAILESISGISISVFVLGNAIPIGLSLITAIALLVFSGYWLYRAAIS